MSNSSTPPFVKSPTPGTEMAERRYRGLNFLPAISGMGLGTLLSLLWRNNFRVDPSRLGHLCTLFVLGVVNSALIPCERLQYGRKIRHTKIECPPLFIIGHFRSGTTYLHNLIRQDPNFDSPSVYQSMFPHHFCFSQKRGYGIFDAVAPKKRPMDDMDFYAAAPYEDEFALAGLCGVSPYTRFLFPVTGDPGHSSLDPKGLPSGARDRWKRSMFHYARKLTYWKQHKRLLLKSPTHMGRIALLVEMFPGAQFIHIVRDPYEVYLSTRHLWQSALSHVHLQRPTPLQVEEAILSWYSESFALFERDRPLLPSGRLWEIRYEDLEVRPLDTLRNLYLGLGLPDFDRFRQTLIPYLHSLRHYRKNAFLLDGFTRKRVAARWRQTFDQYGYPA